ncbi:uncharacterized protein LOC117173152 [Belonocnema kinseyi]|uniref:uncharacterized protein LOC117173152 n=1 Tax=Belonocnema kinseyi TaxID=2817044 RepID=UPI00143DC6F9|nr:uncharacterized protein LOC117173152 [Belonocnema kinseyi]
MRTTIPIVVITSVFYFRSAETSSYGAGSSSQPGTGQEAGWYGSDSSVAAEILPAAGRPKPLAGQKLIVQDGKIIIIADIQNKKIIPFKESTQFYELTKVQHIYPTVVERWQRFNVKPNQWLQDVNKHAEQNYDMEWLTEEALKIYRQHMDDEVRRTHHETLRAPMNIHNIINNHWQPPRGGNY